MLVHASVYVHAGSCSKCIFLRDFNIVMHVCKLTAVQKRGLPGLSYGCPMRSNHSWHAWLMRASNILSILCCTLQGEESLPHNGLMLRTYVGQKTRQLAIIEMFVLRFLFPCSKSAVYACLEGLNYVWCHVARTIQY